MRVFLWFFLRVKMRKNKISTIPEKQKTQQIALLGFLSGE
jgi:hypothetical protein